MCPVNFPLSYLVWPLRLWPIADGHYRSCSTVTRFRLFTWISHTKDSLANVDGFIALWAVIFDTCILVGGCGRLAGRRKAAWRNSIWLWWFSVLESKLKKEYPHFMNIAKHVNICVLLYDVWIWKTVIAKMVALAFISCFTCSGPRHWASVAR